MQQRHLDLRQQQKTDAVYTEVEKDMQPSVSDMRAYDGLFGACSARHEQRLCTSAPAESEPAGPGRSQEGARLHDERVGDDMCGPKELTWEGILQAASASGPPPQQPGASHWSLIR